MTAKQRTPHRNAITGVRCGNFYITAMEILKTPHPLHPMEEEDEAGNNFWKDDSRR